MERLYDSTAIEAPEEGDLYLNSPSVVEALVRDFLSEVAYRRADMNAGKLSFDEFRRQVMAKGEAVQRTMYGQEAGFKASPWNSPEQLGRYITDNLGAKGDPNDAVERLMGHLMSQFAPNLVAYEEGNLSEEMFEAVIDQLIEDYTKHLMGIPVYEDDPDA